MHGIDELAMYSPRKAFSPFSVFKKLIADGNIKFNFGIVSVDLKDDDLQKVHNIIMAIDERRAFYNAFGDEIPKYVVESVRDAKKDIYETSKDTWTNLWARNVAQRILHDLGEFLTKMERLHDPKIGASEHEMFEEYMLELRLRAWTGVAHYYVVFGETVSPIHLPNEILDVVSDAYNKSR
jgi:hypothetical protein